MTRIPIRIDPFFDSDGRGGAPEGAERTSRVPQIPATPSTQNAYFDASQVQVADGRNALNVMRPGPEGLRGTVIPRATIGGIPVGTRPHEVRNLRVTIDPHIDGQSSVVRLGDIDENSVEAATQAAAEVTPDPYDMATQRLRGSAVLHGIAALHRGQGPAPQQPSFEGPVSPGNVRAENLGHYAQPAQPARRLTSPLAAFNAPAPGVDENGRPLRAIDMRPSTVVERAQPAQPNVEVTFEIQHFGTHTAYYHEVITRYPGFLVLVYDNRFRGAGKYFPQARSDDTPPLALAVVGKPKVYLVHTTGFQFVHGDLEFCVLMVERVADAPAEEPQQDQAQ